jgi:hypothetical protein
MTDYFPPSPIPEWPKLGRHGSRPLRIALAERNLTKDMSEYNAASAQMRSIWHRNGHPLICASCGAKTDAEGNLECGH